MRSTDRLSIAVAIAMVLASLTMTELTSDRGLLLMVLPLVALLCAISAISRRSGITSWLVHLWQVLVLGGVGVGLGIASWPGSESWLSQLWQLYLDGVLTIQTSEAPMATNPGVRWLLLLLVGVITIIADVLVLTLATPAWMLAPLLTLYLIPALALPNAVHWYNFLLLAVAYLIVLAADSLNGIASWTRNLVADNAARQHSTWGVWRMTAAVGAPVVALSLLLGTALPALGNLDIQSQRPRGNGPIQLQDPTIELNRNLAQQSERVVMTYNTTNPSGEYLRTTTLSVIDPNGWKLEEMDLRQGTSLGQPPGLSNPGVTETTNVQIGDLASQYLPVPYAPSNVQVAGQWGYDPMTMTVVSTGSAGPEATRNLGFQVVSTRTDPDAAAFTQAQAGTPADGGLTAQVPEDVPQQIVELTAEVTKNAPTDVLKAAAIQEYLRDPRLFTYSTEAPGGTGYDILTNFLFETRAGYCVHFASAMALMARIAGIPSRVAIGFLPGTQEGNTWSVQAKNMHAWPELYFQGYGWVRFEPTSAVADAPDWTVGQADNPTPSVDESASPTPSASAGAPSASALPSESAAPTTPVGESASFPWRRVLIGTGIVLVALALLLAPMAVRTSIRRRRLGGDFADPHERVAALWSELRDTVLDSGAAWPQGSVRERAGQIAHPLSPDSQQSIARLSYWVENSRYARTLGDLPAELGDDVVRVAEEVKLRQTTGGRVAMQLFPKSLWVNLNERILHRN